jgi:hypothetical protein
MKKAPPSRPVKGEPPPATLRTPGIVSNSRTADSERSPQKDGARLRQYNQRCSTPPIED